MYKGICVIDGHVHISEQVDIDYLADFLIKTNTDKANIIATFHSKIDTLNYKALEMKNKYPDRFYCFISPDVKAYGRRIDDLGLYQANYCQKFIDMGADGIKLLEGKPQMRKRYPIPDFDCIVWEPFFKWAEDNQIPILWHVNDPEEFWDRNNAPDFAISQGWLYDDTYVNNEDQYRQVFNVLDRHPNLKIDFAHFLFMSKQLDRLSSILDKYPNIRIDLTPGIEMYENFSNNFTRAKTFFDTYHKRIIYGSDIGGRCVLMGEDKKFDELENLRRPNIVRQFLSTDSQVLIESDGHYIVNRSPFLMKCLNLNKEVLSDILSNNFISFIGK